MTGFLFMLMAVGYVRMTWYSRCGSSLYIHPFIITLHFDPDVAEPKHGKKESQTEGEISPGCTVEVS